MKKFTKILFLFVLLISTLHVFADDTTPPDPITCTSPQILNSTGDACVDPAPICVSPQILVNNICVSPPPICTTSQTLVNNVCIDNSPVPTLNITASVDVPETCNATDTDGAMHEYSKSDSYLAVCALEAGIKNGSIPSTELSNQYPSLGLFITKVNNIGDPNSQYWAIYQNGNYSMSGITSMPVTSGDVIVFQLQGFYDPTNLNNSDNQVTLNIHSLVTPEPITHYSSGGSYIVPKAKPTFDITKATDFLLSQQKADGSFGEDLYTDWTTLALVSNPEISKVALDKITKYFSENKFSGTNTTDYERHAMALMALDLDPYNTNNENYIKDIISKFDGTQFGDKKADNDDIFALIVLQNAGYKIDDEMISADISFILSKQNTDGSWDENVDLTGAGIEALASFSSPKQGFGESLAKAEKYLKQNQKTDGSWQNVSSTAWAMQGILAQGEKMEDWKSNENSPMDYLATEQDVDGGMKDADLNSRIWKTSYALTSASGKTWNQIMQKFPIPIIASDETKTPALINSSIINPLQTTITNSYKNTFAAKIKKYIKPNQKIAQPATTNTIPTVKSETVKKQSFFRRILNKLFGF